MKTRLNLHPTKAASRYVAASEKPPVTVQNCTVMYKNKQHFAVVIEQRFDKIKLNILSGTEPGEGVIIHTNWYENREIKRIW